ncbi:hypothetical protein [Nocardia terpenica]|uniref:hypothetical protein n=1 Tax=Nocardia terpenica TaxID=455432 RepID=UPI0018E07861|nr:hypothetical protein [Nocardia terpenica]
MADNKAKDHAFDIQAKVSELGHVTGFGPAGSDPAYVPDREVFAPYTHQQIWDLVHEKLDPGALGQIAAEWKNRADNLNELFTTFSQDVKREFASWSGTFAGAAQQSTDAFVAGGGDAHTTATAVQQLMSLNSESAQTVRAAIPPPPPPYKADPDPAAEAADGGVRLRKYQDAAAAMQADVQDTMNYVYNPTHPASGDSVPRFMPPPPAPGGDQPAGQNPGGTGSGSGLGSGSGTGSGGGHPAPGSGGPDDKSQSGDGKPGDQAGGNDQESGKSADQTQPSSAGDPAATQPSSIPGLPGGVTGASPGEGTQTVPSSAAASSGVGPGQVAGIGPIGGGRGGSGSISRGGGSSPAGPGRSVPGQQSPAAAQTAGATGRTAVSAAGAPGSPMSGMPHGGRGKGSEEERTKSSPDYLRRQWEELSDLPDAGSGVLGSDPDVIEPTPPVPPSAESPAEPRIHYGKPPMGDGE